MGRATWVVIAAFAALGVACSSEGSDEVVAAPSVLADAVEGVDSGRLETFDEDGRSLAVFQFDGGDDRSVYSDALRSELFGELPDGTEPEAEMSLPEELLTVDGVSYERSAGSERWTSYGELTDVEGSDPYESDQFSAFLEAATGVVVERPGERVERDGVTVTRYVAELTGTEVDPLFDGGPGGSGPPPDGPEPYSDASDPFADEMAAVYERGERVAEYFSSRTTYRFTGDIGADGRLVRLQIDVAVDDSEYPDCRANPATVQPPRVVVTELGEPQGIVAPPADLVDEDPVDGIDDPALAEDPSFEPAAPEDEPMLATASGARPTWAVLEYLRSWADRRGIDWRSVPLPDEAQMVVLFDQFYAQDLAERGPAVDTAWGPYPRGHLVEVVASNADWLGVDAAGVGALADAELVALFEESGGIGADPAPEVPAEEWSPGDPPGEVVDEDTADEIEDAVAEMEATIEELYAGCPA